MKKKLTTKQSFLVSFTLFGMFFGAGNLIFPIHLGQLAGYNYIPAILGFCVTAVGIPVLAIAAIGISRAFDLYELSLKVSKPFAIFFTSILALTIGPFFAIPRCCSTSFTTGLSPFISEGNERIALLLFSFVFFFFVLIFSLKPQKIMTWIGKIINPVFLVFLFVIVMTAFFSFKGSLSSFSPSESYQTDAFFSSLIEGYGTMDAIAGLAFGITVISMIRSFGIEKGEDIAKEVLKSGVFAGLLMAIIYFFTILLGVKSLSVFELSDNGGVALAQVANYCLGNFGSVALAFTITFACLKTSIGLVTSCSQIFVKLTNNKIAYRKWVYGFTIFSFVVANFGLSNIISFSLPVLMFIYPLSVTLILLTLFGKNFKEDPVIYRFTIAFCFAASLIDFLKTLPEQVQRFFHLDIFLPIVSKLLPLYDLNISWILPTLFGLLIGIAVHLISNKEQHIKTPIA